MKKIGKFLFGTITLASIAAGAYYVYKNYIKKNTSDDLDDFDDDFEDDFDDLDTEEDEETEKDSRGYVPINLTPEKDEDEKAEEATEEPSSPEPSSEIEE
jgi:hypothetical protein